MSNSFSSTVSKYHNRLAEVVGPMRGQVVKKADIDAAWKANFPAMTDDTQWLILSDHCSNRTNKGACKCAQSELALFEHLATGEYRVL